MAVRQTTLEPPAVSATQRAAFADHKLIHAPSSPSHHIIRATVYSVSAPAENLRRITVHSPELVGFRLSGPDEFFGLLMPPNPSGELHLPSHDGGANIRASVAAMPASQRPNLRWYTVRAFDPEQGRITFDVVTHGVNNPCKNDVGPGLAWALATRVGDQVGIWTCQGLWHRAQSSQTLIADPSAAPSIRAILEYAHAFAPEQLRDMHLVVVAENHGDLEPSLIADWGSKLGSLEVLFSATTDFSTAVIAHLQQLDSAEHPATQSQYVWVAGEGQLCKDVRHHAIHAWGLNSESVQWCPYWFLGRARP
ncbi:siderophore-interacting protein [Corynebacterium sp.]|uniref:siderophore-interacting protein n=1 Tax=Corynebacterium sp. TaxID=1720 RepID=UPI002585B66A|nr:siderophore-interacting protein [Corynebacterium sp.]